MIDMIDSVFLFRIFERKSKFYVLLVFFKNLGFWKNKFYVLVFFKKRFY